MIRYYPEKIIILDEARIRDSIITKNILSAVEGKNASVSYLGEEKIAAIIQDAKKPENSYGEGKKTLLITANRGEFLKKCPGTNDYICCDYYIIDFAQNCPMECTYCILQAYLNNPFMVVYANIEDLFAELNSRLFADPLKKYRIGTGEFTDSLALEHLSEYSKILMDYFADKPQFIIEFKSKTDYVKTFTDYAGARQNVIISYSMNAGNVNRFEELKTASIEERLIAAAECVKAGYKITLHFDPIIDYDDFETQMAETVNLIFKYLGAEDILYISLGAFRFIPALAEIIALRFPRSRIIYNEFVKGYDKKSRYFRFKREKLFRTVINLIKSHDVKNKIKLYFCMESPEMWNALLEAAPSSDEELGGTLYDKCRSCFKAI
ncbi:MAG TPA: DNA photolyase [Candidatus Wallbacteria bacterium]|nr:DNA photolyase [Candidatus Wallbacteria bacterium]